MLCDHRRICGPSLTETSLCSTIYVIFRWRDTWTVGGMILKGKNWIIRRKTCPSASLSTTYHTWTTSGNSHFYFRFPVYEVKFCPLFFKPCLKYARKHFVYVLHLNCFGDKLSFLFHFHPWPAIYCMGYSECTVRGSFQEFCTLYVFSL
jgi:hypothetical protein